LRAALGKGQAKRELPPERARAPLGERPQDAIPLEIRASLRRTGVGSQGVQAPRR
jgi:hypothetical protein